MKHKTTIFFVVISLLLTIGCGQAEREQKLAAREKQLINKQQSLLTKANELARKEANLQLLANSLDSEHHHEDSIINRFPHLPGTWNVNMICSIATCKGSAVGDSKSERWSFSLVGSSVLALAYTKNALSRAYLGKFRNGGLMLHALSGDTILDNDAQINVTLQQTGDAEILKGKRSISRSDCRIVYDLSLKKQ